MLRKATSRRFPSSATQQLDDLLYQICDKLQLSQTQFKLAEERYKVVGDWLSKEDSPLYRYLPKIYPQGSLKIGTTVKPKGQVEFDLDLVCELKIDHRLITPYQLIMQVWDRITSNETYKSLAELKKRCVRLNYKKEFHLDILPACLDTEMGGTCIRIPNYNKTNNTWNWAASNPKGYAQWFEDKCKFRLVKEEAIEGVDPVPEPEDVDNKPTLKLAVQLIKRWRDIVFENREDIPSIILTTLIAQLYRGESSVSDCLTSILYGIVSMISQSPEPLEVPNPTNQEEDFAEKWQKDPGLYESFCLEISKFKEQWNNMLQLKGIDRKAKVLSRLFGEDIVTSVIEEFAQRISAYRKDDSLYVSKSSGFLTNNKSSQSILVRKNTFYGA